MDYVDLYQIHRWDPRMPIEETMEALHDVVRAGKARYIGASSMYAWQFAKAQHMAEAHGWTPFVSMQNHYNLIYREEEREMIPLCLDQGVGSSRGAPWPGACWRGTGAATAGATPRARAPIAFADYLYDQPTDFDVVDAVAAVAAARDVPGQVALAWLLAKPGCGAHRGLHQAGAPGGRPGRRGLVLSGGRGGQLESPTCPTRCSGTSRRRREWVGPVGSRRRVRGRAEREGGAHAGRIDGGGLPQPGGAGLRLPGGRRGRARRGRLATGRSPTRELEARARGMALALDHLGVGHG